LVRGCFRGSFCRAFPCGAVRKREGEVIPFPGISSAREKEASQGLLLSLGAIQGTFPSPLTQYKKFPPRGKGRANKKNIPGYGAHHRLFAEPGGYSSQGDQTITEEKNPRGLLRISAGSQPTRKGQRRKPNNNNLP